MKLLQKLMISFVILFIILGLSVGIVSYSITKSSVEELVVNHLEITALSAENYIEDFFQNLVNSVEIAATHQELSVEELKNIEELSLAIDEIFTLDKNGIVTACTNVEHIGLDKSEKDYFINGMNGTSVSNVFYSVLVGKDNIVISTPHNNGVLVARIPTTVLDNMLKSINDLGDTGEILLAQRDENGDAVFITTRKFESDSKALDVIPKEDLEVPITQALLGNEDIFMHFTDYRGEKVIAQTDYIEKFDLGLVSKIDEKEAFTALNKIRYTFLLIILIFIALGGISSYIISRSITKPITKLSEDAKKIGKGNLNIKTKTKSKDEIGDLSHSFNEMVKDLKISQNKLLKSEQEKGKQLEKEVGKKTKLLNEQVKTLNDTKTAVLNMMDDLKTANDELKELDEAKSNFLNIVSHELKTPLTAIYAHLDLMDDLKSNLTEQELKSLTTIKRNSHSLKILIDNILEIARMEANKFELNLDDVDINYTINEVIKNLDILSDKKGLKLKYNKSKLPLLNADEQRVREILTNLISNAIKFTKEGSIGIKTEKQGKFIQVSVIDTGVGIPEDKIKKLFQKFYQVDAPTSRSYGGTGLGLSIAKSLVELQGGQINVKSEEGKGSNFYFTLPIKTKGGKK